MVPSEVDDAVQQHDNESPRLDRRPLRRLSTFHYGPSSTSSSDSDSDSSRSSVRVSYSHGRDKRIPWYKKMRRAREKAHKKETRRLPSRPPPLHVAQKSDGEENGTEVPAGRWYGVGMSEVESKFDNLGPRSGLFGALSGTFPILSRNRRSTGTTSSLSSDDYSDFSWSSDEEKPDGRLRVFKYRKCLFFERPYLLLLVSFFTDSKLDIDDSGVKMDSDKACFDSSSFRPELTGAIPRSVGGRGGL
jgi:hypothetical protein